MYHTTATSQALALELPPNARKSISARARHGNVPRTTVHYRHRGRPSQKAKAESQQYLSLAEEKALVDFLLRMSASGSPIRINPFIIFNNDDLNALTRNIHSLLDRNEEGISFRKLRTQDAKDVVRMLDISSIKKYREAAEKHDPLLWSDLTTIEPDIREDTSTGYQLPTVVFGDGNTGYQAGVINGGLHGLSFPFTNKGNLLSDGLYS